VPSPSRSTRRTDELFAGFVGVNFELLHRKANTIQHADALSRYPVKSTEEKKTYFLVPGMQSTEYLPILDLDQWRTIEQYKTAPPNLPDEDKYRMEKLNGLYYPIKKEQPEIRQLWVPRILRLHVMKLFHDWPAAVHVGMARMVATMKPAVYWKSLIKDVEQYVRSCTKCQQYRQLATMTPMSAKPVPTKCLEEISTDVVGPLPSSSAGNRYVLVIQDQLSRYIAFISMKNQTAETVARYFLVEWVCKYGAPKKLITDRGSNFMSTVFPQLCKFLGTTHSPTCAFRPQGNAQNEQSHQQLHAYIAMYTDEASAENWDLLLQYAAWVHNTTVHTALGKSPFEILTGQSPRNFSGILKPDEAEQQFDSLQQYLGMKQDQLRRLRLEAAAIIEKAQGTAIQQRHKFAQVPTYQVGDEVWVKLHATNLINKKWNKKYDGPYVIKQIISPQVVKVFLKSDLAFIDLVHTTHIRRYGLILSKRCDTYARRSP
jgi:transposase InsO family protein